MRNKSMLHTGPPLTEGQRVLIAYHLYKKCFSIRCFATRKVIGYADSVSVTNARFLVAQSGRLRVLRERMKNIHAFVEGEFRSARLPIESVSPSLPQISALPASLSEAYYNPYQVASFVDKATREPLYSAPFAFCHNGKVFYSLTSNPVVSYEYSTIINE